MSRKDERIAELTAINERLVRQLHEARQHAFAMQLSHNELIKWCTERWTAGGTDITGVMLSGFDRAAYDAHLRPILKEHGFEVLSTEEALKRGEALKAKAEALQRAASSTPGVRVLGVDGQPARVEAPVIPSLAAARRTELRGATIKHAWVDDAIGAEEAKVSPVDESRDDSAAAATPCVRCGHDQSLHPITKSKRCDVCLCAAFE